VPFYLALGQSMGGAGAKAKGTHMSKLLVVTDLGTFRAYSMDQKPGTSSPQLREVEEYKTELGDDRISRQFSDQPAKRGRGSAASDTSSSQGNGERHNICLENDRRSVKEVADHISKLLDGGEFDACYLAASSEISGPILEELPAEARSKVQKNVAKDLVNAKREELLQHFA
jgi:hypothetical protein